jgi:hypothetical protein
MSEKARLCCRARNRWPLLSLLMALSPTFSSAAPPRDEPREISPIAPLFDGAPRTHARNGKTRIGRIFFSPAERRLRYANKTPATDAPSTTHAARDERVEINGAVSSSSQGRAVWVNGAAIENSAQFKSAWTDREGNVWLRDDRRTPRLVRPGQAINPATGAIKDLLPAGSVARR